MFFRLPPLRQVGVEHYCTRSQKNEKKKKKIYAQIVPRTLELSRNGQNGQFVIFSRNTLQDGRNCILLEI